MTGNAYEWNGQAIANGWVSSQLPPAVPSIICLQGNAGQGLLSDYGHVAVVEKINADGSVYTSNYNWPISPVGRVTYVTFRPGRGVSFLYASPDTGKVGVLAKVSSGLGVAKSITKIYALGSNPTVSESLSHFDQTFQLINPFDVPIETKSLEFDPAGYLSDSSKVASFSDPVGWLGEVGNSVVSDTVALVLRLICIVIGVYLVFRVIDHFLNISQMIQNTQNTVLKILPMVV